MKPRVLVVDDEEDITHIIKFSLQKIGVDVDTASNGSQALTFLKKNSYNVILLDIMMPVMDGLETLKKIRSNEKIKNIYVIFLSAKSDDISILEGYDIGVDDYLLKPIKMKILIKKIENILKRQNNIDMYIDENLILSSKDYSIISIHDNTSTKLTKKEYKILKLLLVDKFKVISREEIFHKVWGDVYVSDGTLDVHIKRLRTKLNNKYIYTKKGVGYKFAEQ